MKLLLLRKWHTDLSTSGTLLCDGAFQCFTLERNAVIVPEGTYPVDLTYSPKFDRLMPLLEGVQGREGIRIHPGNYPNESDGCILVGKDKAPNFVSESQRAFKELFDKLNATEEPICLQILNQI